MRKIVSAVAAASIALSAVPTAFALGSPATFTTKEQTNFFPTKVVRYSKRALNKAVRKRDMDRKEKCADTTGAERLKCLNDHQRVGRTLTTRRTSSTAHRNRARQIMTAPEFFLGNKKMDSRMEKGGETRTMRGNSRFNVRRMSNRLLKQNVRNRKKMNKCGGLSETEKAKCLNPHAHRRSYRDATTDRSAREETSNKNA